VIKISCILPVNNHLEYLNKSIESILNQTFHNFELIIIVNTKNKKIYQKIIDYKKKDKRIKVFIKKTGNLAELLNYGIHKSKGDFIARQDSDDISHEKRFELQLKWFQKKTKKNMTKVLCGTNGYAINKKGDVTGGLKFLKFSHPEIKERLIFSNCFVHSSVMLNYKFLKRRLRYNKYFTFTQDYDLWTKIVNYGETCNLKKKLVFYRILKKKRKDNKLYIQTSLAILVASNYYYYKLFKKFKKFSKSFKEEIKKLEKIEKLKMHIKVLKYIYKRNLPDNTISLKELSFYEVFKNIRNTLFLKSLIR